jgi:hypothetical protein
MSTPSLTPIQSLSTVSRRAAAIIAAAVAAIAVVLVLLALDTSTTQSNVPGAGAVTATPVKSITPAGANMAQGFGAPTYRHSFAGHR